MSWRGGVGGALQQVLHGPPDTNRTTRATEFLERVITTDLLTAHEIVVTLLEAIPELRAQIPHYHDATGWEDRPCWCASPRTSAPRGRTTPPGYEEGPL